VPLALLHVPVCVSFGLFAPAALQAAAAAAAAAAATSTSSSLSSSSAASSSAQAAAATALSAAARDELCVLDPSLAESLACDGTLTLCVNSHRELCGVHKAGGCPVAPELLVRCARLASAEAVAIVDALKAALAAAEVAVVEQERAARAAAAGYGLGAARGVLDVLRAAVGGGDEAQAEDGEGVEPAASASAPAPAPASALAPAPAASKPRFVADADGAAADVVAADEQEEEAAQAAAAASEMAERQRAAKPRRGGARSVAAVLENALARL
jgi:hypothetical protein